MSRNEDHEAFVDALAERAGAAARQPMSESLHRAGRERLLQRVERSRPRRGSIVALRLALAAVVAGAVALVVLLFVPRVITYEVTGATVDGSYVSGSRDEPIAVRFSDGATLTAEPGSRLRVDQTTRQGARVVFERGRAEIAILHRARTDYQFLAGPFAVRVVGTHFTLAWDPLSETFDLALLEGAVEVTTPFGGAPLEVRAGQRLRADVPGRSVTVTADGGETRAALDEVGSTPPPGPSVVGASSAGPAVAAEDAAGPNASGATALPSANASGASWSSRMVDGRFAEVVADAERRGLDRCLASCSAADLRALADAARYTGRGGIARSSLLALRRRFGGSADGRAAAFLLGRMEESGGGAAAARRWYDTYLAESPGGSFAAEALAGKMRATLAVEGRAAAAPVAAEYLRRYPRGVHQETARQLRDAQ